MPEEKPKKNFKIQKLTLKLLDSFFGCFKELVNWFPDYSENIKDFFISKDYSKNLFKKWIKTHYLLIATKNNKVVGLLVADKPYGGVSFCRWIGVTAGLRQKGIGKDLIKEWERLAKKDGVHRLDVLGGPYNKEFYLKTGFALESFRQAGYFGIEEIAFGKIIAEPDEKKFLK